MLNSVILIGRLTRDPELRYTPTTGAAQCHFALAVQRGAKDEVDYINVVVWDKTAEACAQYLSKGKLAAVQGRLQIRQYTTKEGEKRSATEVVASTVQFLSPKAAGPGD